MCSVTPQLPPNLSHEASPPASSPSSPRSSFLGPSLRGRQKAVVSGAVLVLAAWVGYCTHIFPGHRALTWFELCSDGDAPHWIASDAQDVLSLHYTEGLRRGFLDEIAGALVDYISQGGKGNNKKRTDVLELAAGSGAAPAVWHSTFQEKGLCTRTILTDIQPTLQKWAQLPVKTKHPADMDCGTFGYVSTDVDATDVDAIVQEVVPGFGSSGKVVRMIHLALHHFEPDTVQQLFEDATSSNNAILIVDHSPTGGGVLYNGILALTQLIKIIPGILLRDPMKVLLAPALPLILFGNWHDSTVSVMRSYSQDELRNMIHASGGEKYNIQTFRSASYGDWIGVPSLLQPLFPKIDDHVMNFVLATPPAGVHAKSTSRGRSSGPITTTANGRLQVYGAEHTVLESSSSSLSARVQLLILALLGLVTYQYITGRNGRKKTNKRRAGEDDLVGAPSILAIGTSNPPHCWTTEVVNVGLDWKRNNMNLGDDFVHFMRKVHKTSGVETRWCGDPAPDPEKIAKGERPEGVYGRDGNPSSVERYAYWSEWCPKMAIDAATKAVNNWGGDKSDITHVVFHSCTGFKAPGVELDIIDALKLTNVRRRLGINYMGCFGAFTGMSVAKSFVEADPDAVVLLVCSETCFAHIAIDENRSKSIGNCFFADGAAATIIGAGREGDWAITDQQTKTLAPETRQLMTWKPSNFGYEMFLDKSIGLKFGMHLFWNLKSYLREVCPESMTDIEWCVHPGGRGILDFFCSDKLNLGITKDTLKRSYDVLRKYGNMSSGTILFVLQDMMKESKENPDKVKPVALCMGFGPGLTLEIAELRRIGTKPGSPGQAEVVPPLASSPEKRADYKVPSDCDETKETASGSDSEDSDSLHTSYLSS